jgi:F-type H+-transporting ATPase subunit b
MAAPKGGHYEGMPQLDPAFMPNLLFWLVVTMGIIYFLLSRIALPRISGIIEDRQTAIANDLDQAAELKLKAEQAEAAYEQALKDARAEAQGIAAETRAEIQKELDVAIAKADAEISAKASESETRINEIRASAMKSVEDVATTAAKDIVGAVSPAKADAKSIKAAVSAVLKGS